MSAGNPPREEVEDMLGGVKGVSNTRAFQLADSLRLERRLGWR